MAIRVEQRKRLNALELVSVNDDALDVENSDIEEYKKTGDLAKLKFLADKQPTTFLLNFEHNRIQAENVKNSILGGKDAEGDPQLTLGSWAFRVVKYSLKDIKNPADLPIGCGIVFKKDEKGLVHDDCLNELDRHGLVDELFNFYTRLALKPEKQNAKNS